MLLLNAVASWPRCAGSRCWSSAPAPAQPAALLPWASPELIPVARLELSARETILVLKAPRDAPLPNALSTFPSPCSCNTHFSSHAAPVLSPTKCLCMCWSLFLHREVEQGAGDVLRSRRRELPSEVAAKRSGRAGQLLREVCAAAGRASGGPGASSGCGGAVGSRTAELSLGTACDTEGETIFNCTCGLIPKAR